MVILPVGGGGLAVGRDALFRCDGARGRDCVFVEPAGGASLTAALAARGSR